MLEVTDLTASYGTRPVLKGLSLSVKPGEIVAVLGRNAVGKTTLLKAIMGLVPTSSGRISLAAEDITSLSAHRRARHGIGYVPQGRMIFGDLSVMENLLIGADLDLAHGHDRIDAVLQMFPGLARRLHQRGQTLSGGEQQMLALGRALAGNPKMILLDEPTAGVQPSLVDEIVDRLRVVSSHRGLPMVLVEHNVEMVAALSTRICVMGNGTIVTEIAPEQVHDETIIRSYFAI